jgi:suppressor for copper-sensitivity B
MGVVAALFAVAFLAPGQLDSSPPPAPVADVDMIWQPFDRAAIDAHVAAGRTVLVDVTADWCVTCQFNKTTVLDRGEVAQRLKSDQVVAMRADWTLPDPEIAAYLEDFNRFGIPFNAVYGPALPRGFALPELLSEEAVLAAFDRAGSKVASSQRRRSSWWPRGAERPSSPGRTQVPTTFTKEAT